MENISLGSYVAVVCIVYSTIIGFLFMFACSKKIGLWGIFGKAGEKEWKAIVPIYNQIALLKICKLSPWLIFLYLDFTIPILGYIAGRDVRWALIIVSIGYICYRFIVSIRLGDAFKKGDVFSFFMALLPSIFYPIMGCSKKESFTEIKTIKKVKNENDKVEIKKES